MAKPFFTSKGKNGAAVMVPAVRKTINTWREKFYRLFVATVQVPEISTDVLGMREVEEALKMTINHARFMTNQERGGGFRGNPGGTSMDEDGNVLIKVFNYGDYTISLFQTELGGMVIHMPALRTDIHGAEQLYQCVGQAVQLAEGLRV
mgnify:CR=1 FL=1